MPLSQYQHKFHGDDGAKWEEDKEDTSVFFRLITTDSARHEVIAVVSHA